MSCCILTRWFTKSFLFLCLLSLQVQAELLPTSTTQLNEKSCRMDLYHLKKNEQKQFESNLQLAMITDNIHRQRYIAIKADINHPQGFENIGYYRSGHPPVEIFTANWRKNSNKYSITRLVMLGGTSDRQAFDVFTQLIKQDNGHLELRASNKRYHFTAKNKDLNDFLSCLKQHQRSANK